METLKSKMKFTKQNPKEMEALVDFEISEVEELTAYKSHVITFGVHSDAVAHLVLSEDCIRKIVEYAQIKGII